MAIFQELSGQGRVVGGYLSSGTVLAGGTTPFAKNSDLSIQHASNPFKRHRINAGTVSEWQELDAKEGVAGTMGRAAARAALPGKVGKTVGAGLGAALDSGHTVRVNWNDGKQSIIQFPEKQFMVFSLLLKDRQVATDLSAKQLAEVPPAQSGVADKIVDLASSVFANAKHKAPTAGQAPVPDATEQIAKLASLHAQGILTDAEFSDKKAELLKRI
jgi:hypothetical protein